MHPARIVIVDDNTADVNLLRMALDQQQVPYQLDILETGDAALQFVQEYREGKRDEQPCVILLDLHLPKYDGLAILRAIRQAPALQHIHVVVLSGMASPQEKDTIAALGAVYRQKPFDLNDYLELGAEVLEMCANVSFAAA
jgi:CheY-like chemotaxis protein